MEISTDKERSARIAEKALEIFKEKNAEGANVEEVQAEAAEQALNSIYKDERAGAAGQNGQNQEGNGVNSNKPNAGEKSEKVTEEQVDTLIERLNSLEDRTGTKKDFKAILEEAFKIGIVARSANLRLLPSREHKELGKKFLSNFSRLEILGTHQPRNENEYKSFAEKLVGYLNETEEERRNNRTPAFREALDLAFSSQMIERKWKNKRGPIIALNKAGEYFLSNLTEPEIEFVNTSLDKLAALHAKERTPAKKEGEEEKGNKAAEKKALEEAKAELEKDSRQIYEKALEIVGSEDLQGIKNKASFKIVGKVTEFVNRFVKKNPSFSGSNADLEEILAQVSERIENEYDTKLNAKAAELEAKKAAKEELPTFHDPAPTEAPAVAATEGKSPETGKSWSLAVNMASLEREISNSMTAEGMTPDEWKPSAIKVVPNITKNSKDGVITESGIKEVAKGLRLNSDDQERFVRAMKSALGEPK